MDADLIVSLFTNCGLPILLILLGLIVGGARERLHLSSLRRREQELAFMLVTDIKTFPSAVQTGAPPTMVMGQAFIATDYLKSFLAQIRKILGGELKTYQELMLRARREALLRMLEQAQEQGYNAVCNVRLDSADIGGAGLRRGTTMAGIMATGTAYHVSEQSLA